MWLTLCPDHPRQDVFIKSQNQNTSSKEYERHLSHLRQVARNRGVERILKVYGVDVILGPTDSGLTSIATGGGKSICQSSFVAWWTESVFVCTNRPMHKGYPLCAMPMSYLDYNGRPFSVSAIAGQNQDDLLVKVMSAWEATFPPRRPPPQLVKSIGPRKS